MGETASRLKLLGLAAALPLAAIAATGPADAKITRIVIAKQAPALRVPPSARPGLTSNSTASPMARSIRAIRSMPSSRTWNWRRATPAAWSNIRWAFPS